VGTSWLFEVGGVDGARMPACEGAGCRSLLEFARERGSTCMIDGLRLTCQIVHAYC
jgi:hypothetical protein